MSSHTHFIEDIIIADKDRLGKGFLLRTRFPPEPNGFLHLGHAKAICVNFGLTQKYGGTTYLRFDDTNPDTEEHTYIEAIKEDIAWLGFQWDRECYTSDYFEQLYEWALQLIDRNLAYVDDLSLEEIARLRGDLQNPGIPSPYRNRSVAENRHLFEAMRAGKYPEGSKVLRAKIDMQATNIHMRDPVLYRIKKKAHPRTRHKWCIYPMYDYAHGQSDAIEQITHSLCSLEYVSHRPLYDWFISVLDLFPSHQYEFARLNLSHTLMSKRKLLQLVTQGLVTGWDDPRMPTLRGLKRRGYTPQALRQFCLRVGVAKRDNMIALSFLEHCLREDLNKRALRVMTVIDPIKVILTNYEEGKMEYLTAENNPEDVMAGERTLSFSKELWIEREDFMDDPPNGYHRFSPHIPVRLKYAYIIIFERADYDDKGNPITLYARYVKESKSGKDTSGMKTKATIHWVDVRTALNAELRLYEPLFLMENPAMEEVPLEKLVNPDSVQYAREAKIEASIKHTSVGTHYQFFRKGYFVVDEDSVEGNWVFNRAVSLKASFQIQKS